MQIRAEASGAIPGLQINSSVLCQAQPDDPASHARTSPGRVVCHCGRIAVWRNRRVTWHATQPGPVKGVVAWFDADEGWGGINAPEVPGGSLVHFSDVHADGYRGLAAGERVVFRFERPPGPQGGCAYRALDVWPQD
jgi:cold shock protein